MKYFVLVRFQKNGKWNEITREFAGYDDALGYAKYEHARTDVSEITVFLYELKECFN